MKTHHLRSLLVLFLLFSYHIVPGQNPFNNQKYNEKRPEYVSPPINDIRSTRKAITSASARNRNDYLNFIQSETEKMGGDPTSMEFKSRKHALKNFITSLKEYTENDDWAYMGNDLAEAKIKYFKDYLQYYINDSEVDSHTANEKFTNIKKDLDGKATLYEEPSLNSKKISTTLTSSLALNIISEEKEFLKVEFYLSGYKHEGFVLKDNCEKANQTN
jgi:hypothetical protein